VMRLLWRDAVLTASRRANDHNCVLGINLFCATVFSPSHFLFHAQIILTPRTSNLASLTGNGENDERRNLYKYPRQMGCSNSQISNCICADNTELLIHARCIGLVLNLNTPLCKCPRH
jgi:hypothetical protein